VYLELNGQSQRTLVNLSATVITQDQSTMNLMLTKLDVSITVQIFLLASSTTLTTLVVSVHPLFHTGTQLARPVMNVMLTPHWRNQTVYVYLRLNVLTKIWSNSMMINVSVPMISSGPMETVVSHLVNNSMVLTTQLLDKCSSMETALVSVSLTVEIKLALGL
jgi:hypothetical protein